MPRVDEDTLSKEGTAFTAEELELFGKIVAGIVECARACVCPDRSRRPSPAVRNRELSPPTASRRSPTICLNWNECLNLRDMGKQNLSQATDTLHRFCSQAWLDLNGETDNVSLGVRARIDLKSNLVRDVPVPGTSTRVPRSTHASSNAHHRH